MLRGCWAIAFAIWIAFAVAGFRGQGSFEQELGRVAGGEFMASGRLSANRRGSLDGHGLGHELHGRDAIEPGYEGLFSDHLRQWNRQLPRPSRRSAFGSERAFGIAHVRLDGWCYSRLEQAVEFEFYLCGKPSGQHGISETRRCARDDLPGGQPDIQSAGTRSSGCRISLRHTRKHQR